MREQCKPATLSPPPPGNEATVTTHVPQQSTCTTSKQSAIPITSGIVTTPSPIALWLVQTQNMWVLVYQSKHTYH